MLTEKLFQRSHNVIFDRLSEFHIQKWLVIKGQRRMAKRHKIAQIHGQISCPNPPKKVLNGPNLCPEPPKRRRLAQIHNPQTPKTRLRQASKLVFASFLFAYITHGNFLNTPDLATVIFFLNRKEALNRLRASLTVVLQNDKQTFPILPLVLSFENL